MRRWYDGFIFGELRDIYSPWSITDFLDTGRIKGWRVNTSGHALVSRLVARSGARFKRDFENLLAGGTVLCRIDEGDHFPRP